MTRTSLTAMASSDLTSSLVRSARARAINMEMKLAEDVVHLVRKVGTPRRHDQDVPHRHGVVRSDVLLGEVGEGAGDQYGDEARRGRCSPGSESRNSPSP